MKFLLLKTLLFRKSKDEGFTLPMVIAIGMVMVLLSAVNLVQSGEENLNAISQRGSSDALAAAELGVARYRDFLINNRALAVNNLGQWTNFDNETCDVISSSGGGWADTSDATGWRPIAQTGGSYRIVDYEYDRNGTLGDRDPVTGIHSNPDEDSFSQAADNGDNNNDGDYLDADDEAFVVALNNHNDFDHGSLNGDPRSDARGLLTVQGRDTTGSISQLQVTIPLGINTQNFARLSPALWIEQPNSTTAPYITNFGTVNVNGSNIVLSRPSGLGDCNTITSTSSLNYQNAVSDARNLPPLIRDTDIATFPKRDLGSDISALTLSTTPPPNPYPANFFNPADEDIVLGTSLDDPVALHTDGRYYYTTNTSSLDITAGESIIADGTSKVILHIGGDLDINTGTGGDITRIANAQLGFITNDIGRYLEIHVEGNVNISGTGTLNMSGLLRVGGTVNITDNSTVNLTGAVWANQWNNNSGATVNITLDDHELYSVTPNRTPAPITFRPSGWETQDAN